MTHGHVKGQLERSFRSPCVITFGIGTKVHEFHGIVFVVGANCEVHGFSKATFGARDPRDSRKRRIHGQVLGEQDRSLLNSTGDILDVDDRSRSLLLVLTTLAPVKQSLVTLVLPRIQQVVAASFRGNHVITLTIRHKSTCLK